MDTPRRKTQTRSEIVLSQLAKDFEQVSETTETLVTQFDSDMKDLEEVKQRLHEINKKGGTVEEELGEHITFLMIELAHAKKGQSLMFSQTSTSDS